MAGFENDVVYAKNADFTQSDNQSATEANGLATNGQLWIGTTAVNAGGTHVNVGEITSSSLTIGYSSPNITIETAGGGNPIEQITVDNSTVPGTNPVLPTAGGNITITGGQVVNSSLANVIQTHSLAVNSFAVTIQRTASAAAADTTKNGVSHFNSSQFTVAATGFVSISTSGGMPWTDVTSATQALSVFNGYVTDRGAGVTYTLPATATFGDIIKIDGKLGLTTIAQNANQAIRMSGSISTTGAGGSVAGTNVGDCITLRCTTGGSSTIWIAESFVGNWTVT